MVFTFQMIDAYGDDFTYSVHAATEKEARSIAERACDDASAGDLLKQEGAGFLGAEPDDEAAVAAKKRKARESARATGTDSSGAAQEGNNV